MRRYLQKPACTAGLMAPPMVTLAQSLGARLWEDAPTVSQVGKITAALVYVLLRPAWRTMFRPALACSVLVQAVGAFTYHA